MRVGKIKKIDLLEVAIKLAEAEGYSNVKRDEIARVAGVAMGTVNYHLGTMSKIKKSIVKHAIKTENLTIMAQAIIAKDPMSSKISDDLRSQAIQAACVR